MAQYTRTAFKALYGTSGTVFPDNTTGEISEADIRAFGNDLADSLAFKSETDGDVNGSLDLVSVSLVAGSPNTVTLNMNSQRARRFLISDTISLDFTLAISNVTNFRILNFLFDCDAEVEITMPTSPDTVMPSASGTSWTGGVLTVPAGIWGLAIENDGTYYRAILTPEYIT